MPDYVIRILGLASGEMCTIVGAWMVDFQQPADLPRGRLQITHTPGDARGFPDAYAAWAWWKANKPLTAYTVLVEPRPDFQEVRRA